MAPRRLTRPWVGFSPVIPQNDDGIRIEPPVSEPMARVTTPAATAAAEPDDDPPAMRPSPQGFHTGP